MLSRVNQRIRPREKAVHHSVRTQASPLQQYEKDNGTLSICLGISLSLLDYLPDDHYYQWPGLAIIFTTTSIIYTNLNTLEKYADLKQKDIEEIKSLIPEDLHDNIGKVIPEGTNPAFFLPALMILYCTLGVFNTILCASENAQSLAVGNQTMNSDQPFFSCNDSKPPILAEPKSLLQLKIIGSYGVIVMALSLLKPCRFKAKKEEDGSTNNQEASKDYTALHNPSILEHTLSNFPKSVSPVGFITTAVYLSVPKTHSDLFYSSLYGLIAAVFSFNYLKKETVSEKKEVSLTYGNIKINIKKDQNKKLKRAFEIITNTILSSCLSYQILDIPIKIQNGEALTQFEDFTKSNPRAIQLSAVILSSFASALANKIIIHPSIEWCFPPKGTQTPSQTQELTNLELVHSQSQTPETTV
jgi:hypothetical protein